MAVKADEPAKDDAVVDEPAEDAEEPAEDAEEPADVEEEPADDAKNLQMMLQVMKNYTLKLYLKDCNMLSG